MKPLQAKPGRPEQKIQTAIVEMLRLRSWFVIKIHGSMFQAGLPDLYATHKLYGPRWIEVKNPLSFSFTRSQLNMFPQLIRNGTRVWVLVAATEEEYAKLFKECNYHEYLLKTRRVT